MIKASDVLRPPVANLPKLLAGKSKPPIRASELTKRRHAEAIAAMARAIERREKLFMQLARAHNKVWELARKVKRYESRTANGKD